MLLIRIILVGWLLAVGSFSAPTAIAHPISQKVMTIEKHYSLSYEVSILNTDVSLCAGLENTNSDITLIYYGPFKFGDSPNHLYIPRKYVFKHEGDDHEESTKPYYSPLTSITAPALPQDLSNYYLLPPLSRTETCKLIPRSESIYSAYLSFRSLFPEVSQTPTKIQSFLQWSDSYIAIESQKDVIKSASILIDEIKEELLVITDANRNIATNP